MTDPYSAPQGYAPAPAGYGPPAQPGSGQLAPQGYGQPSAPPQGYGQQGQLGQIRGTGVTILLVIVTLGIYAIVYYYKVHEEMKRHSGQGLGGGLALVLALFVSFVMPFLTAGEVGGLYERRGQPKPVSGATGAWIFLPLAGSIIWFVKTNGALNAYWRSLGVQG